VLYYGSNQFTVIPKRVFESAEQQKMFEGLLTQHVSRIVRLDVHEMVPAVQREIVAELQRMSNEALLTRVDTHKTVMIGDRTMDEHVWRDTEGGVHRIIVQHDDKRGSYVWAAGFVIDADGSRRPLTDVERRIYL
jgi:hypothetical protein